MAIYQRAVFQPWVPIPMRIRRIVRILCAGIAAGFVAGLVAGGMGSRIAMRIVALVAGKDFYGHLTEASERVGEITRDGSLFLIVAPAVGSIPFGIAFVTLRSALPGKAGWQKGLVYGLLLLAIFGSAVIEGDNFDFRVFVSPYLAVGLFAMLFPLFGMIAGVVAQRIAAEFNQPAPKLIKVVVWIPITVAVVIGINKDLAALQEIFR